jgi:hypothetical protein
MSPEQFQKNNFKQFHKDISLLRRTFQFYSLKTRNYAGHVIHSHLKIVDPRMTLTLAGRY